MKYLFAILLLPFCFLTEAFIVVQWFYIIHVSWWWIVYFILADTGSGVFMRAVLGVELFPKNVKEEK